MAEYISQRKFAKMLDISASALTYAIRNGTLIRTEHGIDLEDPATIEYIEHTKTWKATGARNPSEAAAILRKGKRAEKSSKPKPKKKAAPKKPKAKKKPRPKKEKIRKSPPPSPSSDPVYSDLEDLYQTKREAELEKSQEQARKLKLQNQRERNELVPRILVRRVFGQLYLIDTNELRTLGDKLASEVAALCGVDDPNLIVSINQRIETEVFRSLEHIKKRFNDFLLEVGGEVLDDDSSI
jgi:hypothetical protein